VRKRSLEEVAQAKATLFEALRCWAGELEEMGATAAVFVTVEQSSAQGIYLLYGGEEWRLPVSLADWETWGRECFREWWAVSARGIMASLDGEPIPVSLLTHPSYMVGDQTGTSPVYLKAGGAPVIYFADDDGVETCQYLPPVVGGSVYYRDVEGSDDYLRMAMRHELLDRKSAAFDSGYLHQGSTNRTSQVLVEEIRRGIHTDMIRMQAQALRRALPALKAGVPAVADVRSKLEMEAKLRQEDGVTGSLRPLAFTLEALEGGVPEDVRYPGLWLVSTEDRREFDVRGVFKTLLLWDSVLYLLAAACRFHGEFKPGVVTGREGSRTVYLPERRYSKRDSGDVDAAYLQLNPGRVAGNVDAVAARLLQLATHELAHLANYSNVGHTESFVHRREAFFNAAADQFSTVRELVALTGVDDQRYKPVAERPLSPEQFLAEEMTYRQGALVEFLVNRWAAIRNITLNKAEGEILLELRRQEALGRLWMTHEDRLVRPIP
jgi:hypothetical protein